MYDVVPIGSNEMQRQQRETIMHRELEKEVELHQEHKLKD